MSFILKAAQKVQLALEATDADGDKIALQGPTAWSSSDTSVVEVDANGVAQDPVGPGTGSATISASDTTADGVPITASIDIAVVPGDASVFNITAGTPTDR